MKLRALFATALTCLLTFAPHVAAAAPGMFATRSGTTSASFLLAPAKSLPGKWKQDGADVLGVSRVISSSSSQVNAIDAARRYYVSGNGAIIGATEIAVYTSNRRAIAEQIKASQVVHSSNGGTYRLARQLPPEVLGAHASMARGSYSEPGAAEVSACVITWQKGNAVIDMRFLSSDRAFSSTTCFALAVAQSRYS